MNESYDFKGTPVHRSLPEEFSDMCVSEEARHILIKRRAALGGEVETTPQSLLDAGMWNFFKTVDSEKPNE